MYSEYERLSLLNQYRILEKVDPEGGWGSFATILQYGYEGEYRQLTEWLHSPMSAEKCEFVINALAVFDALQRPWWNNFDQVPDDCKFSGFDGNIEGEYLSYFRFLREQENKFVNLVLTNNADLNSHFPTAAGYSRMITKWTEFDRTHELSAQQRAEILQARAHQE